MQTLAIAVIKKDFLVRKGIKKAKEQHKAALWHKAKIY